MLTITEEYKEKIERIKQKLTKAANDPDRSNEQRKLNKTVLDEFLKTDTVWRELIESRIKLEKDCLEDIMREEQLERETEKSS